MFLNSVCDWKFGNHPDLPAQVPANDGGVFKAFTNDETELGRCCTPGIPKFGRWKRKDQEFKGILGHRANLKTA